MAEIKVELRTARVSESRVGEASHKKNGKSQQPTGAKTKSDIVG
jgi:hypothetical protein